MQRIFGQLVRVQQQQAEYIHRRQDVDRESRFKVHRSIPKITADGASSLLEEFTHFEQTFQRTNPRHAKEWVITLEDALDGAAKTWRGFIILTPPGRDLYEATCLPGATQQDYITYYR